VTLGHRPFSCCKRSGSRALTSSNWTAKRGVTCRIRESRLWAATRLPTNRGPLITAEFKPPELGLWAGEINVQPSDVIG